MSAPFCKTSYLRAFGGVLADVYDETGKQFYKVPPRPKITFQRVVEALADAEWRIKIGDTFPLEETLEPPDETDLKIVWAARKKEIEDFKNALRQKIIEKFGVEEADALEAEARANFRAQLKKDLKRAQEIREAKQKEKAAKVLPFRREPEA